MQRFRFAVALAVTLLSGLSAYAQFDDCRAIVRVGIPRDEKDSLLRDFVAAKLQPLYRNRCTDPSIPLQIQFAFGSDYQMLEWLDRGAVDAAVLTDLAAWILGGGKELSELRRGDEGVLPAVPRMSYQALKQGAAWKMQPGAGAAYTRFLDEVLQAVEKDEARESKDEPEARPAATVVLATHLSNTGFLHPVTLASRHFALHNGDVEPKAVWRKYFQSARFTIDCDTMENCLDTVARDQAPLPDGATVLYFPGEEMLQRAGGEAGNDAMRQRLVMVRRVADELFWGVHPDGDAFRPLVAPKLDSTLLATLRNEPPADLRRIIHAERQYGVRIHSFTVDESLRLLHQQQRRSGDDELALVLPGGGVKAAYQTGIVEWLYNRKRLWNDISAGSTKDTLAVRTVIGTSGGALLGFFVSQLQPGKPIALTSLLWRKPDKTDHDDTDNPTLVTADVFSFTDLPRYVGVGAVFLIFALLLAFFSGLGGSKFYQRGPCEHPSWRRRLFLLVLLFLIAPLLVRAALGGDDIEHVPIIDGIFYTMMALVVMFADHCIVDQCARIGPPERRRTGRYTAILVGIGLLLVVTSAIGGADERDFFAAPLTFGISFFVLALMFIGAPLLLLYLTGSSKLGGFRFAAELTGVVLLVLLLCALSLPHFFPLAQLMGFFFLVGIGVVTFLYTRHIRTNAIQAPGWVAPLLSGLTLFFTAMLCWPTEWELKKGQWFTLSIFRENLDVSRGAFFVAVGLLLLLLALAIHSHRDDRYVTEHVDDFLAALGVMIAHTLLTIGTVYVLSDVTGGWVHSLEMTPSFWMTLILAALFYGGILLATGAGRGTSLLARNIQRGVRFLVGEHHNGSFIPRRYARMMAVISLGVIWWNVVIAPAIYGNRPASKYIKESIRRFHAANGTTAFNPTARFIATANLLERDGTFYFAFHPAAEVDAEARIEHQDGAEWRSYPTNSERDDRYGCTRSIGPACQEFVRDVVFASGSPFPIFAAHRIRIPGEEKEQWFVDGGYSNVIPVGAAKKIAAAQVLIVHSSNPLDPAGKDDGPPILRPGRLVMNAGRLPGFLFERSQQLDRLSRQEMFVVALAPPHELQSEWPNLAQFDERTVRKMLTYSADHRTWRIGMVESWGQPRFRAIEGGKS